MAGAAVGALRVTLGANTASYETGMRSAARVARTTGQDIERSYVRVSQTGLRAFSTLRTGAAGLAAGLAGNALFQYARGALEWASGLTETARQIGVTVEQLQALRMAAEQNGASVEGMERAMGILNRTLGQAQGGSRAAIQAFRSIGITPEQLSSFRTGGEALQAVITALSNIRNPAQQAAAAQALFGRGARELMVMLTQGAGAMERWTAEARAAGMITDEQARKADEAADALSRLSTSIRAELINALADAMPGILAIIDGLGRLAVLAIRVIGFLGQITNGGQAIISSGTAAGTGARLAMQRATEDRWRQLGAPRRGTPEYQRALQDPEFRRLAEARRGMAGESAAQTATTGNVGFDAAGGAGGRRSRDQAERRRHQMAQELLDADIANLRARIESTQNIDEINGYQRQIAAIENRKWEAEQDFRVTQGEINQAHVHELYARKRILVAAEADAQAREYNLRVAEQENERAEQQQGYARERVQIEAELAETMAERRRIELELLRITMQQRRDALALRIQRAQARNDSQDAALAQLELDNLPAQSAQAERRIRRDTMGPLESYMRELPRTAAQVQEALEGVAVEGLGSITDALVDVVTGARSMGSAFKSVVAGILADLLRIQIQRSIVGPLSNVLSGLFGGPGSSAPGFMGIPIAGMRAAGGPVLPGRTYVVGEKGPELLRMGGAGHVIANDNIGGAGGDVYHLHLNVPYTGNLATKQDAAALGRAIGPIAVAAIREHGRRRG